MLAHHRGLGITPEQRLRFATLMSLAADDAALPDDPEFRAAFVGYVEWGTRLALHNSQPDATVTEHALGAAVGLGGGTALPASRARLRILDDDGAVLALPVAGLQDQGDVEPPAPRRREGAPSDRGLLNWRRRSPSVDACDSRLRTWGISAEPPPASCGRSGGGWGCQRGHRLSACGRGTLGRRRSSRRARSCGRPVRCWSGSTRCGAAAA
jgi:hypothetical protein